MKKQTRTLLILGALAAGGYYLYRKGMIPGLGAPTAGTYGYSGGGGTTTIDLSKLFGGVSAKKVGGETAPTGTTTTIPGEAPTTTPKGYGVHALTPAWNKFVGQRQRMLEATEYGTLPGVPGSMLGAIAARKKFDQWLKQRAASAATHAKIAADHATLASKEAIIMKEANPYAAITPAQHAATERLWKQYQTQRAEQTIMQEANPYAAMTPEQHARIEDMWRNYEAGKKALEHINRVSKYHII